MDTEDAVSWLFGASFFALGLINNVLYVVILSAALDLVDSQSTPKGVILICNIFPALLVKVGWPYLMKGRVRYGRRILACSGLSFFGIIIVAVSPSLGYRLMGIATASFSSGLGEMTYLQLSTVYGAIDDQLGGRAIGWFASGTGAAGLVGAGLWWVLRGLGVRQGLLICAVLPLLMITTFKVLLPSVASFRSKVAAYDAIPVFDVEDEVDGDDEADLTPLLTSGIHLTRREKLQLARPLVFRYMMPLFFVYLAEYIINTGVAPTLLFPVPTRAANPVLATIIKSLRDYYPLWQLVYQTFVFFSRSSLSIFRLPPLPRALIPLPTVIQVCLLMLTTFESYSNFLSASFGEAGATWIVAGLIAMEGISGGLAYVNVFYRLGLDDEEDMFDDGELNPAADVVVKGKDRREREREFRIASVGFADTLGILMAALISTKVEPWLCASQVARGRTLCKEL